MELNKRLFLSIEGLRGKSKLLDYVMIFGAEAVIYLTLISQILLAFTRQEAIYKEALISSILAILLALAGILIIHIFIKEKRPYISFRLKPLVSFYKNLSFPSTHTTIMTILTLSYLYYQINLGPFLLVLLFWLAFSRIYIGVHYPLDILGGLATGSLSFILVRLIFS